MTDRNDLDHQAVWPPHVELPYDVREQIAREDDDYEWRAELRAERREWMVGARSVASVAGFLGVSKATVRRWIKTRGLPFVMVGRRRGTIPNDAFLVWCERNGYGRER